MERFRFKQGKLSPEEKEEHDKEWTRYYNYPWDPSKGWTTKIVRDLEGNAIEIIQELE